MRTDPLNTTKLNRLLWLVLIAGVIMLLLGWIDEEFGFLPSRTDEMRAMREELYLTTLVFGAFAAAVGLMLRFTGLRYKVRTTLFVVLGLTLVVLVLLTYLATNVGIVNFG